VRGRHRADRLSEPPVSESEPQQVFTVSAVSEDGLQALEVPVPAGSPIEAVRLLAADPGRY
jgi:hypothetical protein